jgi:hypothetical protein
LIKCSAFEGQITIQLVPVVGPAKIDAIEIFQSISIG